MKDETKYRVTYNVNCHPEGVGIDYIEENELGACDCLFIASILGQPGGPGSLSVKFASLNGFKGSGVPLTPLQEFNIFGMLAHYLADNLPAGKEQEICQNAFEQIRELVTSWLKIKEE